MMNIGNSTDPFFRYKMPELSLKHEKFNGGKTIIENLEDHNAIF